MDLSVKFEEPIMDAIDLAIQKRFADEYTPAGMDVSTILGGLTGTQLSLLRQWEEEEFCKAEIFPVSPKGPAERCMEPNVGWAPYCVDHLREEDDPYYYDQYDLHRDREYE